MSGHAHLLALTGCLRGEPADAATDWDGVLTMANRCWLAPALHVALLRSGNVDEVPADVRDYLALLHTRNRARNGKLLGQIAETVAALNRAGVEPMLLKGAAILAAAPDDLLGARMMRDIDLLVAEAEIPATTECLAGLGYRLLSRPVVPRHDYGEFGRPQDVGALDLHLRPPGPPQFHRRDVLDGDATTIACGGGRVRVPSPTIQALHLIVHDQILEGDYLRGRLDLRHLHDLAMLAGTASGIDWRRLVSMMPTRSARNALETQAVTLSRLFGVSVPASLLGRLVPRLQHRRRLFRIRHPALAFAVEAAYGVAWIAQRLRTRDTPDWFGRAPLGQQVRHIARKVWQSPHQTIVSLMGHEGPKL